MGETAALIGLGAAGLGSGLLSSSSARSNNKESIAFSKWSQLESQRYNQEMYEKQLADQERLYNSYQSPQAIAQALSEIGVNPSSALTQLGGKGMPSVPSASGSSPVGAPHLENEGLALGQGIQSVAGALNSVANAKAQSAQAKETQTLLQEKLNQLILQNNGQELYNAKIAFDKYAAEQKLPHEINDLINDVYLKYYQGKHEEAATGLAKVQMDIANEQYKITKEQAANVGFFISKQLSLLDEDINLSKSKQKTEKSVQAANYAGAENSRAQAVESRTRTAGLEFDNVIKGIDSANAAATAQQKLASLRDAYERDGSISQVEKAKANVEFVKLDKILKMYREHSNKAALDAALDNFNDHFPVIGGFIKALK